MRGSTDYPVGHDLLLEFVLLTGRARAIISHTKPFNNEFSSFLLILVMNYYCLKKQSEQLKTK